MARVLMPLPGSRVIPTGWAQHHRPPAESTMTARCTIDVPGTGGPVWNEDTGTYDPAPRVVLHTDLPCRVQQQNLPREATTAGQQVTSHLYLVAVPITVLDAAVGQQLRIDVCPDDPSLVARRLTLTDVMRGSLAWERDLICIDHLG